MLAGGVDARARRRARRLPCSVNNDSMKLDSTGVATAAASRPHAARRVRVPRRIHRSHLADLSSRHASQVSFARESSTMLLRPVRSFCCEQRDPHSRRTLAAHDLASPCTVIRCTVMHVLSCLLAELAVCTTVEFLLCNTGLFARETCYWQ